MKNNKLLYTSIFLIIITLLLRWWVEEQYGRVDKNERFIELAIENQVFSQELEMIPVLDSLSLLGKVSLTNMVSTPYPFFIFKNGDLKYWSDSKIVPDYDDIKGAERYRFIDKSYGQFIVRKWVVNYKEKIFEVYALITLYRKYPINNIFIQSGYNPKIVSTTGLIIDDLESIGGHILEINGNQICKLKLDKGFKPSIVKPILYIDFALLLLQILLFIALYKVVLNKSKVAELIFLFLGWAYFKLVLPILEGTTAFVDVNIFDPQYYAVSWFERSFGDLLINSIFILLISIRIESWLRDKRFLKLFLKTNSYSFIIRLFIVFFSFWIINYPFFQLRSIYDNSQISIDISQSLQFDWIRIITYVIVVFVNISTFLFYHAIIKHVIKYTPSLKQFLPQLLIGLVLYVLFSLEANMPVANLAIVNLSIVFGLWYFNLTRSLNSASYRRFLYIALFFGVLSSINGYFINSFESQIKVIEAKNILAKKLSKSDPFAEFLVASALVEISSDQFIVTRIQSPFLSKTAIVTKIKQVFLNSYLNKYEQSIVLFDSRGMPLRKFNYDGSIFKRIGELQATNSATDLPSVFKVSEEQRDFSKHYIGYASIKKGNSIIGYVLVDLVEKQFSNSGVYPSLLIDNRFRAPESSETSLGFYVNGKLLNSIGTGEFSSEILPVSTKVWRTENLLFVSESEGNRSIVASTTLNNKRILLSNFSFIWIITLIPILVFWIINSLVRNKAIKSLSYTDRIIWYLNLAFIIPLIVVTVVTFRLLSNSFDTASNLSKTTLVERLSNQISGSMLYYINSNDGFDRLQERLEILSNNTELDINLFNLKGELVSSSQPSVFNKKLLSPFINQYALGVIRDNGKNQLVLQESIDKLSYSNSYVAVKSEDSGQMLGVISVPFFSTNSGLNSSKREAFNTILNVFVIVLFATILATFFAGKWLTKPLKIIRDKLKATSFSEQTEPIQIHWSDELGLLIKAYNQMLNTLEGSKAALKQSEKEKAWREAAQQVAHEIKNPLTPMKLTLQRVTNKIKTNEIKPKELEAPLLSVLDQVETLNSIASSFSEFAKMPTPVVERVEVHSIINQSVELFSGEPQLNIKLQLANQEVYSKVDPKLLARMFNNLILNAKQSIRDNQKLVELEICTKIDSNLLIEVTDNGAGISPDIAGKVFIPRFTTKEQGSGIGLAMTKYGVENMGGKIYFISESNSGTTFTMEFPIID